MDNQPKKILVVDDEQDLRDALRTSLEGAGFEVIEAVDGEEGLKKAEEAHPDLILLDITMPKMNGHQVLNRLRQTPWGLHIHVLILTNADDPLNIAKGVGLHSDDYIIKAQTSLEEIIVKVKQHLAGYHD
jgi:DNA-binding response OmpR family regulator